MSSKPHKGLAALLLFIALVAAAGCGRKEPPLPPLRAIPAPTEDLQVAQQGRELVLTFSYPQRTLAGAPLPELARVELWRLERPLPAAPEGEPAAPRPADPREFAAAAELALTLAGRDLAESVFGDRLVVRLPLPEAAEQARSLHYAVRSVVSEREASAFSNQAMIAPRVPPSPPGGLTVTATSGGVEIAWEPPEGLAEGGAPAGYRVYRRDPRIRVWGDPLTTVGAEARNHLDAEAVFGQSYIYAVTTLAQTEPAIESAPGGAREIEYRDRFAPPPPGPLEALGESGRVRLLWEASEAEDVAGYHVWRRGDHGDFERLTAEPVAALEHLDRDLPAGASFTYRITAVDREGNEGEPGEQASATVR